MNNLQLFPLNFLSVITCHGIDAQKFLQGQLSCQLEDVDNEHATLGAYLNHKGRVVASFYLLLRDETYYLILHRSLLDATFAELKRFALFSKVELEANPAFLLFGYINSSENDCESTQISYPVTEKPGFSCVRMPFNPERLLIVSKTGTEQQIKEMMATEINTVPSLWLQSQIDAGITEITAETSGLFTPHELNYHCLNAVSFDKGCYRGQEIVARMHYRGTLKQHLYRASVDIQEVVPAGTAVCNQLGEVKGAVVNAVVMNGKNSLLVTVKDDVITEADAYIEKQRLTFLPLPYSVK